MKIHLSEAKDHLLSGQVIAVPTETVYGLAAFPENREMVQRLFDLKGRSTRNPINTLVSGYADVQPLMSDEPEGFRVLAEAFWPGPLTLVVPIDPEKVLPEIRADLPTAGFRVPQHPLTLQLLREVGPLVVPSANLSGKPSATSPEHVEQDFGTEFPVLDGGSCDLGVESTVLIFDGEAWRMGRIGAVSAQALAGFLGYEPTPIQHPTKASRYQPNTRFFSAGTYGGDPGVVLGFEGREYPGAETVFSLGSLNKPQDCLKQLFTRLRELDEAGIGKAWVDLNFPKEGPHGLLFYRLSRLLGA